MTDYDPHNLYVPMANAIRALSMDAVEQARSGHPGMPMGMADVMTVLADKHLVFDPDNPDWSDRDRLVLSAGHGSMLLYAFAYLSGYKDITIDDIKRFRQWDSPTAGHPEWGMSSCVETTTGPLGQGLANAVGMALAERKLAAVFGDDIVNHRTYVIAGDGCLMEGISHEAASLAGHWRLGHLTCIFDNNGISIDGPTSLSCSDDVQARFRAYGWHVQAVDGHDPEAIDQALQNAFEHAQPSLISCRTTIGYGSPNKHNSAAVHGAPLGAEEIAATRQNLDWPHPPFVIPDDIIAAWRRTGQRGAKAKRAWVKRLDALSDASRSQWDRRCKNQLPDNWESAIDDYKAELGGQNKPRASRQASSEVLSHLIGVIPELVGGSADLTGSNLTYARGQTVLSPPDYSGDYIHYGVREHAMAAIMNGLSVHGGWIPYGGTFLVFSDYCRNAIRLSALMKQGVIYVMTHDSIGLGEDGPTHQPIEHLASLRAMPNTLVFRPADAVETAECWAIALAERHKPSILCLSRQALPSLGQRLDNSNRCRRGAYVLGPSDATTLSLLATGSEVAIARQAQAMLSDQGIKARVVSMPCWALFDDQSEVEKIRTLGANTYRIAIEAGASLGWHRYLWGYQSLGGVCITLDRFGASAPAKDLYPHLGLTAQAVVDACHRHAL